MAPSSKLRKAIGAVKDQTSISLAKVGNSTSSLSDLEIAIVKATRHEEYPAEERHIREILSLTCYSRSSIAACIDTISRRLRKTKNWIVALKTLTLIHRLLSDGDPAYEHEIFFATRRGTRLLNLSDFRDCSRADAWDYSAFVRTYAMYLDEQLEFKMQGKKAKRRSPFSYQEEGEVDGDNGGGEEEEEVAATPKEATMNSKPAFEEMKTEMLFTRIQNLMRLLERFLACYPTGSAGHNGVVLMALNPIIKESFRLYNDITEIQRIMIDRFTKMEFSHLVIVYEIFCRLREQFDELDQFYHWCKRSGVARSLDFPDVRKITQKKLDVIDDYVRGKYAQRQNRMEIQYYQLEEEPERIEEEKEDTNAIKALPPPLPEPEEEVPAITEPPPKTQTEGDLLNLGDDDDATTVQENGDKLALALFDYGGPQSTTTAISPWEAFNDNTEDWELALVQSASYLGNQKTSFSGGFDMLMLDGMYQQGSSAAAAAAAKMGYVTTGSASSVALGSVGRPAMLALPAPPSAECNVDPFAASLAVPPPSYVQMSEMEKKRRLLVEEQQMWQEYSAQGQGQNRYNMQQNPYMYNNTMGG